MWPSWCQRPREGRLTRSRHSSGNKSKVSAANEKPGFPNPSDLIGREASLFKECSKSGSKTHHKDHQSEKFLVHAWNFEKLLDCLEILKNVQKKPPGESAIHFCPCYLSVKHFTSTICPIFNSRNHIHRYQMTGLKTYFIEIASTQQFREAICDCFKLYKM